MRAYIYISLRVRVEPTKDSVIVELTDWTRRKYGRKDSQTQKWYLRLCRLHIPYSGDIATTLALAIRALDTSLMSSRLVREMHSTLV